MPPADRKTVREAARVVSSVRICGIRLVETDARCRIRSPKEVSEDAEIMIRHSAQIGERPAPDTFYVRARIEVKIAASGASAEPHLAVSAVFEIKYRVPQGARFSAHELEAFADTNAIFNVWPFWREYIQSVTGRMDLPAVVLPLFRVPAPQKPRRRDLAASRQK